MSPEVFARKTGLCTLAMQDQVRCLTNADLLSFVPEAKSVLGRFHCLSMRVDEFSSNQEVTPMENAPAWIRQLVTSVSKQFLALNSTAEIGCHIFHNQSDESDEWEITVFGEPVEWGGRLGGRSLHPVFSVDAMAVVTLFDRLSSCRWQTGRISSEDDLGPHLSVEGEVKGHQVWLRIVGRKPEPLASLASASSV